MISDHRSRESGACHANDRKRRSVQGDRASQSMRVGSKPTSPEIVVEYRPRVAVLPKIVFGPKQPADSRSDTEHLEVIAGHQISGHQLGARMSSFLGNFERGGRSAPTERDHA